MRRGAPERPLRGLDPERQLGDPATRQRYVTTIFDLIAPRYDAFTRWFSLGMDRAWKRDVARLARAAAREKSCVVADLACGTGDLAFALAAPGRLVVGLDVSHEMLRRADARAHRSADDAPPQPRFAAGDMVRLPLADASVDVVTVGYGLRNASNLAEALDEVARILRPDGHVVTLDFFIPDNALWRRLFLGYLAAIGGVYGWAWHREPAAYGYIARSIRRFVTARALSDELARRGITVYETRRKLLGGIAIHAARKK
jgi:demethylmenaquinone methyltransferase/2-methoxy-6-polyprenyl-1,4-benzoquinol methylase